MRVSASVEVMGFNLEQHIGLDPHVEISREELELGLPPSMISDAFTDVQGTGYRIGTPSVSGTGNSKHLRAGPNGSILASSTSATDLQQAEVVPAANGPDSHPDLISWPLISSYESSLKGAVGEDLMTTIFGRCDDVQQGEIATFRQPPNSVAASYSFLPLERLTEYKHEASKESPFKITSPGNDAPICKESDAEYRGKVLDAATKPGNGSKDVCLQKEVRGPLSVERPDVTSKPPSVHMEHSNGKGCAETECSGPTGAGQRLQSESEDPDFGSCAMPTSFSGLFQSIISSENPSSQLVETASQPNGLASTSSIVPIFNNQAVTDIVNTTTRLMFDSLNQPPIRLEPPGFFQVENALGSRNKMNPNTALEARPASLPIQTSFREARVASAATTVSAAASAAKNAVQAAEASIEALANLGINNGSLYQGRNSFVNPRPLKVACGSRPEAAGVKRTFEDHRPPIVEQTGGKNTTGTLDLIKIGCAVEVMPEEDGLQGGWFIAKVLSMTSKEATVVYDDLMTEDGCSYLEESFPLHCSREEDSFGTTVRAAQGWIRPVHPFSSSQKRDHFMTVCENWVVGDRVDAFVEDSWWEAIIEDLNEADETKITVYFPGDGSTTVVKAWNVRPTLVWKKGEWRPCRGDSVEQAPPPKRQKTGSKMEREQTKTKVAAVAGNPVLAPKRTPEPLAISQTRRSGASRNDDKGMVIYSKKKDTGQFIVTPTRELRSATRSNANVAQTKAPLNSSITKTRIASRTTLKGSSQQQMEVAVTPDLTWDVRRQSTRFQPKELSKSPQESGRGKTPSSRSSKKELVGSPQAILRRKTPSRRSQHKEVMETPGGNALAIIPVPETRSRTRSQTTKR